MVKLTRRVSYYGLSVIIGFLALAYGSVPLYKMVRDERPALGDSFIRN
jgi:cytochrome c oxidase assembly protein Cox11